MYQYKEEDLNFLVNDNPIIPNGREEIIRKGLHIGLHGELYPALHILLPQMEAIIRYLVELCSGKTFYIEENGDVHFYVLERLLDDPELNTCIDPDFLFFLKGLLVKKEGSNLRNEISHSFMEPGNSPIALYFLAFFCKFLNWYSISSQEERQRMTRE